MAVAEKLVEQIVTAWTPVLVEACQGSGKHSLAKDVARATGVDRMVRLSDPGWQAMLLDDAPVVIVEGDSSALEPEVDQALAGAVAARLSEQPCVIFARRFGQAVYSEGSRSQVLRLNEHQLWWGPDALAELFDCDQGTADLIHQTTDGWPTVVSDVLAQRDRTVSPVDGVNGMHAVLAGRMQHIVGRLSPEDRGGLIRLATLEAFDHEVLLILGLEGVIPRLAAAGVPLPTDGQGWSQLTPAVRSWVTATQPRPEGTIKQKLLDYLAGCGRQFDAAECAIAHGQREVAAAFLAGLDSTAIQAESRSRLLALCNMLADQEEQFPRLVLVRAISTARSRPLTQIVDELERCRATVASRDLDDELRVRIASLHYYIGNLDTARAMLEGSENACASPLNEAARLEFLGGLAALESTEDGLRRARALCGRAAALYEEHGRWDHTVNVVLALEVEMKSGHLRVALQLLRRTESQLSPNSGKGNGCRVQRARLLALLGKGNSALALAAQSAKVAEARGNERFLVGILAVQRMVASLDGDLDRVRTFDQMVRQRQPQGDASVAIHIIDAAYDFLRFGAVEEALRCLADVMDDPAAEPFSVATLRAVIECAHGDPTEGRRQVAALLASELVVYHGDWLAYLVDAAALARLGDQEEAQRQLGRAYRDASSRGTPEIVDKAHAWALRIIEGVAEPLSASVPRARCDLRLLGDFELTVDGLPVELPPGRVRTLVKLLVFSGGSLLVDQAIEALWPEVDPTTGRRRFRNVLNRLRARCGPIIERDGELLRLDDAEFSSDFARWRLEAQPALNSPTVAAADLDLVLTAAPDELSPDDRYEAWFEPFAQTWRIDLLRLVDRRIELAIAARDPQTALAMYHRSLDLDPDATARIESAIDLAISAGLPDGAATFEQRRPSPRD